MLKPRNDYRETVQQVKTSRFFFGDTTVKVITNAVSAVLADRAHHPYETYIIFERESWFDCATIHSKTPRKAERMHDAVVAMFKGVGNEA